MASNSTSWMNNSSWSPSRASTKNPFDDSNGDPFDDVHATPLQDIETGTTVRLSTETQQRDTVVQSSIPSEEKRIIEDIRNERQTGLERPQLGNVPNVKRPNARSPRKNAGVERVSQYMTTIPFRTRALMVFAAVSQNALMETSRLAKSHAIQDHASMNAEGVPMIVYPTPQI
ncbi:hypothetical protein ACHAO8_010401 [Botrytis cinerea]